MSLALGILFCTAKKVSKKLPTEKTRFYIITSLWQWRPFGFGSFMKIDVCSDRFFLAWAFVVPQGKPQGL
jgi:hypothetical protein